VRLCARRSHPCRAPRLAGRRRGSNDSGRSTSLRLSNLTFTSQLIWQLGILAHEFPPSSGRARAAAFSSFSAGAPIGGALGMVLGGLVTQLSKYGYNIRIYIYLSHILFKITDIPGARSSSSLRRSHSPRSSLECS
jgi:hypothetical protein